MVRGMAGELFCCTSSFFDPFFVKSLFQSCLFSSDIKDPFNLVLKAVFGCAGFIQGLDIESCASEGIFSEKKPGEGIEYAGLSGGIVSEHGNRPSIGEQGKLFYSLEVFKF